MSKGNMTKISTNILSNSNFLFYFSDGNLHSIHSSMSCVYYWCAAGYSMDIGYNWIMGTFLWRYMCQTAQSMEKVWMMPIYVLCCHTLNVYLQTVLVSYQVTAVILKLKMSLFIWKESVLLDLSNISLWQGNMTPFSVFSFSCDLVKLLRANSSSAVVWCLSTMLFIVLIETKSIRV